LPRTPGHFLYARADAYGFWLDVAAQSESFLDQANFQRVDGRALVGGGVRQPIALNVAASLAIANATNVRTNDVYGFPMPGRSYFLSLDWSH
jgi:outer membrane cobalamin receptor